MTRARFAQLSNVTLGFTLLVILWGAFVRITGSGAGCGNHWPTCGGEVVPQSPGMETVIEYTHRLTSALSGLLVLALAVLCFRALPKGHVGRRLSWLSLFFMITEGAVGAGLVLFEKVAHDKSLARGWWMGAHLINTFLLIAMMALTAWSARLPASPRFRAQGRSSTLLFGGLFALVVTGVTGAIAALGDTLFPARSLAEGFAQDLAPQAHLFVQLRGLHPFFAAASAVLMLFVAGTFTKAERTRALAQTVGGLVVAQVIAGVVNLLLRAPPAMQLLHLLLADLVWISAVILTATAHTAPALAGGSTGVEPSNLIKARS